MEKWVEETEDLGLKERWSRMKGTDNERKTNENELIGLKKTLDEWAA
jgi:hypothetical protein